MDLFGRWSAGGRYPRLMKVIGHRVKREEFYVLYGEQYLNQLFGQFEKCLELAEGDEADFLVDFLREHFQYEVAVFYHRKVAGNLSLKKAI